MKNKIKVIYILGEGRSGSTLVERILGQHSEIFSAGELKHIWERSFKENQLCSCGKAFNECDIWGKILDNFELKDINPNKQQEAQEKISRLRHFFTLKNLQFNNKYRDNEDLMEIINAYYELYKAILKTTGKKYVLDASKHPVFALLLSMHPDIELSVIHLVRDVRGVAYSWRKKKIRPEITTHQELMPRYSVIRTAISWDVVNFIGNYVGQQVNTYTLLRYEDIIQNPKNEISNILELLKLKDETNHIFMDEKTVQLNQNHTVSGNPMRFKTGEVNLRLDEEWKEKMNKKDQIITNVFTFPLLKKYRYV
ncbi:sulfotransferase family protein [Sulfurovum sp. TSL6]|uniref:sulfotransferase n=1 Tax=Sulfurovum sp. TSL6 TaxID=2826995 RepID=UPI001CC593FD|nr:sulfotransferase [Sulfurovum sp. TSL6]GIU00844.1 sulfotransferase family protein [Sulfurovum sp. TSL6]